MILAFSEVFHKRVFKGFGVKVKHICQELAITTFLLILTSFNAFDSETYRNSGLYSALEWVIVGSVFVAIGSELFGVLWGIRDAINNFLKNKKKKAKEEAEKKLSEIERKCQELIEDEPEFEQHRLLKKDTSRPKNGEQISNTENDEGLKKEASPTEKINTVVKDEENSKVIEEIQLLESEKE